MALLLLLVLVLVLVLVLLLVLLVLLVGQARSLVLAGVGGLRGGGRARRHCGRSPRHIVGHLCSSRAEGSSSSVSKARGLCLALLTLGVLQLWHLPTVSLLLPLPLCGRPLGRARRPQRLVCRPHS